MKWPTGHIFWSHSARSVSRGVLQATTESTPELLQQGLPSSSNYQEPLSNIQKPFSSPQQSGQSQKYEPPQQYVSQQNLTLVSQQFAPTQNSYQVLHFIRWICFSIRKSQHVCFHVQPPYLQPPQYQHQQQSVRVLLEDLQTYHNRILLLGYSITFRVLQGSNQGFQSQPHYGHVSQYDQHTGTELSFGIDYIVGKSWRFNCIFLFLGFCSCTVVF